LLVLVVAGAVGPSSPRGEGARMPGCQARMQPAARVPAYRALRPGSPHSLGLSSVVRSELLLMFRCSLWLRWLRCSGCLAALLCRALAADWWLPRHSALLLEPTSRGIQATRATLSPRQHDDNVTSPSISPRRPCRPYRLLPMIHPLSSPTRSSTSSSTFAYHVISGGPMLLPHHHLTTTHASAHHPHVSLHPRPCTQIGNVVLPPSLQRTHYCTASLHRAFTR
jgi:hypothetical protein